MPSRDFADRWPGLLPLGGHPSVDMPPHVVEAAARAAERAPYAPTRGLPELREAVAELHGADPARNVLITLGGMQALYLAALLFGRRSVTHAPGFFFPQLIAAVGGSCVRAYDWDELRAAVGAETTLVIANTPVNPTGYVFRAHDLEALADAVADSECLVLSDEAYYGLVYDGREHLSPASHPALAERTLVLRSFSKTQAMAGWRVGYAVGPAWAIEEMAKELQWQALAIDSVAQTAALAALTGPQEWIRAAIADLAEARAPAVAAANATGLLRAEVPEAAAFLWAEVDGEEDRVSEELAREHGVTALPGRHFGSRTPHLRIPIGGPRPAREALLRELVSFGARRRDELPSPARP